MDQGTRGRYSGAHKGSVHTQKARFDTQRKREKRREEEGEGEHSGCVQSAADLALSQQHPRGRRVDRQCCYCLAIKTARGATATTGGDYADTPARLAASTCWAGLGARARTVLRRLHRGSCGLYRNHCGQSRTPLTSPQLIREPTLGAYYFAQEHTTAVRTGSSGSRHDQGLGPSNRSLGQSLRK